MFYSVMHFIMSSHLLGYFDYYQCNSKYSTIFSFRNLKRILLAECFAFHAFLTTTINQFHDNVIFFRTISIVQILCRNVDISFFCKTTLLPFKTQGHFWSSNLQITKEYFRISKFEEFDTMKYFGPDCSANLAHVPIPTMVIESINTEKQNIMEFHWFRHFWFFTTYPRNIHQQSDIKVDW